MSQEQSQVCPVVELVNDRPATTFLKIAECFGKRHDHVVRDIRALIAECPEDFHKPNFGLMSRKVKIGNGAEREEPYYTVYFDGFMLLVMGYTGKKALDMKLAYIGAFNAMREQIEASRRQSAETPLTPLMQSVIRALVKAKIEQMPEQGRKLCSYYPQVYSRFNAHFNVARHDCLPQGKLAEAIAWLVNMEIKPRKAKALEKTAEIGAKSETVKAAPGTPGLPDIDPATYKEGARIFEHLSDLTWRLQTAQNFIQLSYPARSMCLPPEEQVLFDNVNDCIKAAQSAMVSALLNVRSACRVKSRIKFVKS